MKRYWLILLTVAVLQNAHALRILNETSFKELVQNSTDIVVGRVITTSKTGDRFRSESVTRLRILSVIKGTETKGEIAIHYDRSYEDVDVNPEESHNYIAFLRRAPSGNKYYYAEPEWGLWEVCHSGQAVIQKTSVRASAFLDAIKSEMHRTPKPLPREFYGITMGDTIEGAEASSGLRFTHYKAASDSAACDRYNTLLSRHGNEHRVEVITYKKRIIALLVYYSSKHCECLIKFIQEMETKRGGTPLGEVGDISFIIGRRWTDENVDIHLNGYPDRSNRLHVTDQHVLRQRLKDMRNLKER
ncbi:MAG: hypothetical protein HZC54_08245 [Verrucomicrobia bacterium]|nr:hypothetical protein [Verrucomicrobiota bacterium]